MKVELLVVAYASDGSTTLSRIIEMPFICKGMLIDCVGPRPLRVRSLKWSGDDPHLTVAFLKPDRVRQVLAVLVATYKRYGEWVDVNDDLEAD